jgi:hypothetical protein
MKSTLLYRLRRLEAASYVSNEPAKFRYGWLTPLPADHTGERHAVVTSIEATRSPNIEWCQFEERPGPPPANADAGAFTVYFERE